DLLVHGVHRAGPRRGRDRRPDGAPRRAAAWRRTCPRRGPRRDHRRGRRAPARLRARGLRAALPAAPAVRRRRDGGARRRARAGPRVSSFREDGAATLEWVARYLERRGEHPVLAQVEPGAVRSRLPATAPEQGEPFIRVLEDLDEILLPAVTHWNHPR